MKYIKNCIYMAFHTFMCSNAEVKIVLLSPNNPRAVT